jgi:Fe-S cluster assembly protein SufD
MQRKSSTYLLTEKDRILSEYQRIGKGQSDFSSIRQNAMDRFQTLDFPTTRQEDWKYTNLKPVLSTPFEFFTKQNPHAIDSLKVKSFSFNQSDWIRLVFFNGFFLEEFSNTSKLPTGFKLKRLSQAVQEESKLVEEHFARQSGVDQDAFYALNTALFRDGAYIYIPEGKLIEKPIQLIFITSSLDANILSQPRNLVIAGAQSQATLIESYVSLSNGANDAYFTNGVTEIVLNEGAVLDHYKIQNESPQAFHVFTTQARLGRNSNFSSFSLTMGALLSRYNLHVLFDAEGGETSLNGLYVIRDSQHADHQTVVDHLKPHCTSHQLYKGILNHRSTAVFNGRVFVRKNAQQTDAHQVNKNLLLSEKALVNTKPQLEIFNNDVKCTHGAAIGQLDEEALFYLRSRGVGQEVARDLLVYGFASEVVSRIKVEPLRQELDKFFYSKFEKKASVQEVIA